MAHAPVYEQRRFVKPSVTSIHHFVEYCAWAVYAWICDGLLCEPNDYVILSTVAVFLSSSLNNNNNSLFSP